MSDETLELSSHHALARAGHDHYLGQHGSAAFERPHAFGDGVRFTVRVDETPFEFTVTRQALEDLEETHEVSPDLLAIFLRQRDRIEGIALDLLERGARWPHLVIRMQDVR